uniref:Trehalase n=1 Tax=Timema douglasi TaxID=61478 RepID=A0A7R8VDL0_TIMDO|nr:unnamed protein product [Timema douglasi]
MPHSHIRTNFCLEHYFMSTREDFQSAKIFRTEGEKEAYYSELKAAAESGWDFSSRWFILNATNKGGVGQVVDTTWSNFPTNSYIGESKGRHGLEQLLDKLVFRRIKWSRENRSTKLKYLED